MDMGLPHRRQGTGTPDGSAHVWRGATPQPESGGLPAARPPAPSAPAPADIPRARPAVPATPPPPAVPPPPAGGAYPTGVEAGPPPMPAGAPQTGPPLADWLRLPRPAALPGIWRCGYRPRPPEDPDRIPARQLVSGAVVSFLMGWLLWSLLWHGYLGSYWQWPLAALTPESWRDEGDKTLYVLAAWIYNSGVFIGLAVFFGRIGRWDELARRVVARLRAGGGDGTGGAVPDRPVEPAPPLLPTRTPWSGPSCGPGVPGRPRTGWRPSCGPGG